MNQDLETRTREIGLKLYRASSEIPSVFDTGSWKGRLMEWAMKDQDFKVSLFRYTDVLPSLKTDALVVRLLNEYFSDTERMPLLIRLGMRHISKSFFPHVAARVIRSAVRSLALSFIAGRDPEAALRALKSLWKHRLDFSVDLLGEETLSKMESEAYARKYIGLIDFLVPETRRWKGAQAPQFDISIKVSSFDSQIDPVDWEGSIGRVRKNLRPVLAKAQREGVSVCFDMEQYYYKDLVIGIFKEACDEFSDFPYMGIALQAYLKDTRDDLLRLIAWARERKQPVSIRLVKGAYWDYETVVNRQKGWPVPVFQNKEETDRSFEELTEILLKNTDIIRPAIATHNIRSISRAVALAEQLNLPEDAFEFQMLYGMGEPLRKLLRGMDYRVRVYTPVGELIPGMAYLVRRLLENTANESFLRKFFSEKASFEEVISPPGKKAPAVKEIPPEDIFRNEPPTDFSKSAARENMKEALKKVRAEFPRAYPIYIGDKELFTGTEIISLSPADSSEVVGRVSSASRTDADTALKEAGKAWEGWKRTPPEQRAVHLFRAAEIMRGKRFELSALEIFETGKTWKDADADVAEAIDHLEYYGREMLRMRRPQRLGDYPGEENEYLYEGRGVGVVISPWNFPLAIPTGMVSAGLVTGNCVIFKPSGLSPVMGWKLTEIFRQTGLPHGILQFLPGPGREVGEYLVSHPDTDFIAFTGSKNVGMRIIRLAGETHQGQRSVKRVIAEMGGKNAIIVDETAEPDEAIKGVLESSLGYQGQKCSACSRVIVAGEIYDEFCERLKNAMESITIGPPERPDTFMGPVIDENAFRKINDYIEIGRGEGKPLLIRKPGPEGHYIGPVIFTEVDPSSRLAQEEIFGPVVVVISAKDIDDAIAIANGTPYALTGGIYSRSPANLRKAKENFRVGNLYINRKITGALVGRQPFGGFGMSGVGSKAGGPDYLLQFMETRSISENTLRRGFAPDKKNRL